MDNPMLAELDEVVRLMDAATPGPWALEHERCGDVSIVNREHQGDDWDIATAHYTQPANAELIARSVNFLRTHAPALADMAKRMEAAERKLSRLTGMRNEWERDAREHLMTFGQHLPASVECLVDRFDAATQEGAG